MPLAGRAAGTHFVTPNSNTKQVLPICLLEERKVPVAHIHPQFHELSARFSIKALVGWFIDIHISLCEMW